MADCFDIVTPRADTLMESLRATGYSLPDAISDLIDNSIYADARNIWLNFHWAGGSSWVSILDDGCGMSETRLLDAMRVGSRSPNRSPGTNGPGEVWPRSQDCLNIPGQITHRCHPSRKGEGRPA